jgi:hypothetical protein
VNIIQIIALEDCIYYVAAMFRSGLVPGFSSCPEIKQLEHEAGDSSEPIVEI